MEDLLANLKGFIWGTPLLAFLIGTGVFLTIILRGMQFRYIGYAIKQAFAKSQESAEGDISHFEALMTTLGGAIGTGAIVGVSTAITVGGVGALFWMWVTAIVGMATKYAESLLAVKYRVADKNGEMIGGPMEYIDRGLGWRWLALLFAAFGCLAAISTGNLVQVNSIVDSLTVHWSIDPLWIGAVVAVLVGLVIMGGVRSIGHVAGFLVPFMALFYVGGGLVIIGYHYEQLPTAIAHIFISAFRGDAAIGGFSGATVMMAIQMGVARSIFSNEAGLGISSIAAAAAKTDAPGRQAMIVMTGALLSTLVVCTITGLVIAVTGLVGTQGPSGELLDGAALAIRAFESTIRGGGYVVTVGLVLFALSTIIAWAYYGEKCFEYLFGERAVLPFRCLFTLAIIPGALMNMGTIWHIADISNGLMVIPNLIALIGLSGVIVTETRHFLAIVKRERGEKAEGAAL
ncbi:MAG: sodium:alanine symporter family protein [Chlamydiales bacterium]|nr:sodium:alanine symporter family protein [Chlamydiia bacterium]MCP5506719.1 sodium:alanine symporter family protein [Chlamydiales bacterium]